MTTPWVWDPRDYDPCEYDPFFHDRPRDEPPELEEDDYVRSMWDPVEGWIDAP